MAARGLTKSIYSGSGPVISVVSAKNERLGVLSTTWFALEFSEPLQAFTSANNIEAFFVTGQKNWSIDAFNVLQVVAESDTKVAVQVEDFDAVDAYLNITYAAANGTLKGTSGADVHDTVVSILLQFPTPRIKVRSYWLGGIRNVQALPVMTPQGLTETVSNQLLSISPAVDHNETFEPIDLSGALPSVSLIGLTETTTAIVLS